MTTLQFIDARRRTLRPWHVVGTALLLAMLAFAMWSLSARAAVSSVTFTAVDSVAGTADATFEISFASANNDAFGIEVTFPAEFSLTQGAVTVVSTCGAFSEGALCRGASQINTNLSATAVGQTIHLEIPGTWNLAVGMISFRVTSGITNPDVLTNGGVYAGAGFTVATLGTVNRSEPAVAAAADVVLVASGPPATITLDGPAIVEAGVASDDFTLTVRDEFGNEAEVAEATTFTISGSDIGAATLEPASPIGIASGQSSVTFTYNQTAAGDQGVSASFASGDTNLAGKTSNSHEITVNPAGYSAAHSTVAVTGDSSLTYPETTTVTLTAHDQFSNRIPTLTSLTVTFALTGTGSSTGTFGATSHQGAGVYQSTFTGAGAGTARTLEGRVGDAAATLGGGPTITVTPKALTVSGVTASDKVYNGNTVATVNAGSATFVGVVDGDTVTLGGTTTGTFADKSVDTSKTVTVAGITAGGADGGNYVVTQPTTTASITAKPLTAPGVAAVDKVYDNTTTATLDLSSTGMTPYEIGDIVQVSPDGYTATFASENVGTGIAVTVTGLALRGPDAANYTLTQPTGLTADITVRAITVTAGTDTRVYNRTNASSGTPTVTSGTLADGDTIAAITQSFQFGDIGSNKLLNVTGVVTDGNGGANYDLTRNNAYAGTITAKPLTVPGVTASSKPYDRTNTATLDLAAPGLTAVESNDDVSLNPSSVAATFASASAGEDIAVTVTGLSLSGGDAYNYTLTQPSGLTADITPLALTVYNVTASDKAYDGTTTATVDASTGTGFTGVLNGDIALIYGMATGAFSDPNAGTEKAVIISGITAGGTDGGNYTVTQPTVFADITAVALTVTGVTASDKAYNGNTTATVNADAATFVGVLDGDTVDVAGTPTGAFADKNVDDDKTVTVAGITAGGADGGNYTVTQPTALANITAVALTVTGATASDKAYDGDTTATVNADAATFVGVVDGDTVTLGGTATGTFANDDVGNDKTVTIAGITAGGDDGGNYTVTQPTTTASITARALTVTGVTAADKVYDTTATATVNGDSAVLAGVIDGDDVIVDGYGAAGTYADGNVGTSKMVTVSGITAFGDHASNYTITQPEGLTANITAAPLTVIGVTASDKVDNGNTTAAVNADSATFVGVLGDDSVTVGGTATGTFANDNVGNDKTVTIAGITAGGDDGGNYTVTQPTATASITAVPSSGGSPSGSGSTPTPTPTQTPTADPSGPVVTLTDEDSTVVTAGEPTVAETQSSSGGTAEVTAPAGALPAGTTLTAASIDDLEELVSQAPAPADAQVLLAFVIEATDAQGNPLTGDFAQPLALEFNVPAESVPAGATAGEIVLAFWNGVSWTEVQGTVLFNADGTVTIRASVDHLTIFSVQHQPGRGSFSPAPAFAVSFTVWGGGGYELLDTAVGAGGAAWVMVDGRFHGYSVGAPAFVNASFRAMLPAGIASNTAVVVTRPR